MPRVVRGRGPHYVCIPHALLDDPDADAYAIATYAALRSYADFGSETGAEVSDTRAAKRAGCAARTFRYRREWLRERGWIEWRSGKEDGEPNAYVIHASLEGEYVTETQGSAPGAEGVGTTCRGGSAPHADNLKPSTESQDRTRAREGSAPTAELPLNGNGNGRYPPAFESAWSIYPARAGGNPKKLAHEAWQARVKEGVPPPELEAAVRRYAKYIEAAGKTGTELVMMARTFFGPNERWKDEFRPPPQKGKKYDMLPDL